MKRRAQAVAVALIAATAACGTGEPSSEASAEEDGTSRPTQGVYGNAPAAVGGVPSVIMLTPAGGGTEETEASSVTTEAPSVTAGVPSVTIDQFGLTFSPAFASVPTGTSVSASAGSGDGSVVTAGRIDSFRGGGNVRVPVDVVPRRPSSSSTIPNW